MKSKLLGEEEDILSLGRVGGRSDEEMA